MKRKSPQNAGYRAFYEGYGFLGAGREQNKPMKVPVILGFVNKIFCLYPQMYPQCTWLTRPESDFSNVSVGGKPINQGSD